MLQRRPMPEVIKNLGFEAVPSHVPRASTKHTFLMPTSTQQTQTPHLSTGADQGLVLHPAGTCRVQRNGTDQAQAAPTHLGTSLYLPQPWKHLVNLRCSLYFMASSSLRGRSGCLFRRCWMYTWPQRNTSPQHSVNGQACTSFHALHAYRISYLG